MSTYTRPVMLLLCGLLLLTLTIVVLDTLVPLWLIHENLPIWQVSVVSSSYFTGNLVGALLTGYLIKHFGFNRSYYIALLIFAAGCAGLGTMVGSWSWMTWCFIAGVGCAMIWAVVESASVRSGTLRNRGRLLAAYMMIHYVRMFLGRLLVSKVPAELMNIPSWVTGTTLVGVLPPLFTRTANQQGDEQQPTSIVSMLRLCQARLGVNGCIISGTALGSLYDLMPLYLNRQGVSNASIGFWMVVLVSVGTLEQWPISRLVDKLGRLLVLHVQVFVVIVGSTAMLNQAVMAPALFMLGAADFTLYPVAMVQACEKAEHHQLVAMNQALLLSYTVGSLLGPPLIAVPIQSYSDSLLFIMIVSVPFIYLLILLCKTSHASNSIVYIWPDLTEYEQAPIYTVHVCFMRACTI